MSRSSRLWFVCWEAFRPCGCRFRGEAGGNSRHVVEGESSGAGRQSAAALDSVEGG